MRTAITIITAAALVLHFSLGCWAHNEHAAGEVGCAVSHSSAVHAHGHEADEQHSEPAPTDDVPGGECSKGQCYFTNAAKVAFSVGVDVSFYMPVVISIDSHGAEAQTAALLRGSEHLFGPAVRPHLFNQVILI
jgi:hypothetical protein